MLSHIPRSILKSSAVFSVPTSFDRWQNPQGPFPDNSDVPGAVTTYTVENVHLQADNTTHRTAQNTEVVLRGILYVDSRYSTPALDFEALQRTAHAAGGVMTCTVTNRHGDPSGPYTVVTVDALPDDEDNLHHWELGLV